MLKKLLVIGGLVVVVAWACGNGVCREIGSYVKTGWSELRKATKNSVSIDFEIKRAEDMLANLDKADERLIASLATEIQILRRGESEIERMQANLETMKFEVTAMNEHLKGMKDGGIKREGAMVDLEKKFTKFKQTEKLVKITVEAQARHKERMEMIKEQRDALKQQRVDLAARLDKLKTELEVLKLAEARSKHAVSEGQVEELNQLKALVDGLEQRVEKQMIILELKKEPETKAPGSKSSVGNNTVMSDVDAYFGTKDEKAAAVKK
jgi:hypothetical protein